MFPYIPQIIFELISIYQHNQGAEFVLITRYSEIMKDSLTSRPSSCCRHGTRPIELMSKYHSGRRFAFMLIISHLFGGINKTHIIIDLKRKQGQKTIFLGLTEHFWRRERVELAESRDKIACCRVGAVLFEAGTCFPLRTTTDCSCFFFI